MASKRRLHRADKARDRKKTLDRNLTNYRKTQRGCGWLAIFLAALFLQLTAPISSGQEVGEVVGTVRDVVGASIAGATVEFISQGKHYTVTVSDVGGYATRLIPGTYSVTARALYFCKEHRATFSIAANQKAVFDFILPVGATDTTPQDDSCYKEDAPDMGEGELHSLVLYGARSQKGGQTFYLSLKQRSVLYENGLYVDGNYPAVFSYDLLTLQADRLVFDSQAKSITAIGNVTLQNGVQTQRASKINIEFARAAPLVKVIQ